jgi:hypothetical protein
MRFGGAQVAEVHEAFVLEGLVCFCFQDEEAGDTEVHQRVFSPFATGACMLGVSSINAEGRDQSRAREVG